MPYVRRGLVEGRARQKGVTRCDLGTRRERLRTSAPDGLLVRVAHGQTRNSPASESEVVWLLVFWGSRYQNWS